MNRFLKNLLLVAIITPFMYFFCLIIWGEFFPKHLRKNLPYDIVAGFLYSRLQEIDNFKNVDILVLGSSKAYRGYDPRIFNNENLTLFNLGSSAQTPIQTEILIDRYLNKINPKLILFDVFQAAFIGDGVQPMIDLIANDTITEQVIHTSLEIGDIRVLNTLAFGLYKQYLHPTHQKEPQIDGKDTYISGGYVESELSYLNEPVKKHVGSSSWKLNEDQKRAFERIMKKIKKKGYRVVLVQSPVACSYYESYRNNIEIDKYFSSTNVPYFNFNKSCNFSGNLFLDEHHLNQKGVEAFNKILIKALKHDKLLNSVYTSR